MNRRILLALFLGLLLAAPVRASQLLNVDVHDADLSDVIALLASESGKNLVADASLKPDKVTLHLHAVTFDEALDAIVNSHDLQVRRDGAILIVGSSESMNRRYGDANDPRSAQTAVLSLAHASPDDVAKELTHGLTAGTVIVSDKRTSAVIVSGDATTVARARRLVRALDAPGYAPGGSGGLARAYRLRYLRPSLVAPELKGVLPDGSYVADDGQNAIVVSGNAEVQENAQSFIKSLDVPSPQVMFEVRVADLQPVNDQSDVGFEFGGYDLSGQPISGAATYAFAKNSVAINARLNAMVSSGHAQILATPKLVTLNNKEADLLIGQTYPVVYYDARLGGQQVQFVDVGVKLRLTPTIGSDGSVTAEMHPEYSAIQTFVGGYPVLANRKVDSTLRVKDNETIVLGGLLRDIDSETITKLPGLANIPVFGKIFQNRQKTHERDEVVFLITPHVLYPDTPPPTSIR
ncbi:MAG TPA: secretin N-terminal domain-containing protein [Candidatus Baltobacteraceae bacterium]